MAALAELSEAIINGNAPKAKEAAERALSDGVDPMAIVNQGLLPGMAVVGDRFKRNEYYIPEVLLSARAMKGALALVQPLLGATSYQPLGTVVVGTVKGDLHDIGKNLVSMMLEGAGFKVVDLGVDVSPEKFIAAVQEHSAQIVGLSALLTTTMVNMRTTIDAFTAAGVRDSVKVIVGGAPVTQRWADEIGADGFAADAASGVDVARALLDLPPQAALSA
ncbi:MAG TPA: corrinoid protein [Chloroflexota bacterium]|nr:corrinoid protein [Chloroflexota bacterium]